jgi:transcriptional regulator with XRE-family HTH domain
MPGHDGVDELAGLTIGQRIQVIRERRGKSRAVVAGLVGRTDEWLKAVEKGRLHSPRLEMLLRLAEALELRDLSELVGDTALPIGLSSRTGHSAVPAIRAAIEETPLQVSADPPPDVDRLAQRTAEAWRTWHTSSTPRADVGAVLPSLLRDTQRAVRVLEGRPRRKAYATLSELYALAEQVLSWVADAPLVWLVADRGMHAAQQADDPLALAGAAWVMGNVWRTSGREAEALDLVDEAALLLEPRLDNGTDEDRGMWGALRLHAAITAARMDREGDALRYWDLGSGMAARMPDGYVHPWTAFGTPNAQIIAVSVHADLRQGGRAIDSAEALDPDSVPSIQRQAMLWLDMARSYQIRKDRVGALNLLTQGCEASVEVMACHPMARGLAGELVVSGGPMVERKARRLAARMGMTV